MNDDLIQRVAQTTYVTANGRRRRIGTLDREEILIIRLLFEAKTREQLINQTEMSEKKLRAHLKFLVDMSLVVENIEDGFVRYRISPEFFAPQTKRNRTRKDIEYSLLSMLPRQGWAIRSHLIAECNLSRVEFLTSLNRLLSKDLVEQSKLSRFSLIRLTDQGVACPRRNPISALPKADLRKLVPEINYVLFRYIQRHPDVTYGDLQIQFEADPLFRTQSVISKVQQCIRNGYITLNGSDLRLTKKTVAQLNLITEDEIYKKIDED